MIIMFFILALAMIMIPPAYAHQELRNDIPVIPHALSYCFMRYDSGEGGKKDTYLECNMVEGFTQEQLKTMREHLEEYAESESKEKG